MSNNMRANVQDPDETQDARAARSLAAVRHAMATFLRDGEFDDVTVQRIIDRAGIARATFYAHYRNKDDALLASFEGMMTGLEHGMDRVPERCGRLVPITELLEHLADSGPVVHALRDAGRLDTIWSLGTDLITDLIARRIPATGGDDPDRQLRARMLAGACLELVRWWTEQPVPPPPASLDARFHAMAQLVLATC